MIAWPFDSNLKNCISFYNEVAVSAYLYVSFLLTDYLDLSVFPISDYVSWTLTSILMFTIFLNLLIVLKDFALTAFAYIKRIRQTNQLQI
jgi:hypothetical protein